MYIREAMKDDNDELRELQAACPQGTRLIVSTVNTPDFFARAKAYESYKIYVACEDDRIIGSAACAIREAVVNGNIRYVGHQFQGFTSPHHRKKGVARKLLQQLENHLIREGVVLSYALIMEDNIPSMRLVESMGFHLHRTLVMPALSVFKEMDVPSKVKIRTFRDEDVSEVAELLNKTWEGFEMYNPVSAETLYQFVTRTPQYSFDDVFVLEDQGEISACLGFWDWSRITRITVLALKLPLKLHMMRLISKIAGAFLIMPPFPRSGDILKQGALTPIGFKDLNYLAALIKHMNNHVLLKGIRHIFCLCEPDHVLLQCLKGFIRVDTTMHMYVKPLQTNESLSGNPVFLDGIDL